MGEAVEEYQVGPNDPKTMCFPLTFLDTHLAGPIYVKRQFFYNFPNDFQHHFLLNTLKHTLSLALEIFFPLAGNLICPPEPNKPFIQCTKEDTVTFKIATVSSSNNNFDHLSSNGPKKLKDLDHLIPKLTYKPKHDDEDTIVFPLYALQATVWENHGICIAITYCHVMDDRCCDNFMKTWSSLCRKIILGGIFVDSPPRPPPCFDRNMLKGPKKLEDVFLGQYFKEQSTWKNKIIGQSQSQSQNSAPSEETEHVKATIVFGSEDIKRMKTFALKQLKKEEEHNNLSTFVVTCAFVWSSLVKTRHRDNDNGNEKEEVNMRDEYFRFAADCTERLGYPIPESYFGNCIAICYATLKKNGGGGFLNAVRVIQRAINDMKKDPLRKAKYWKASFQIQFPTGLLVTGSPKFLVYDTDFGFGRPVKVEMKHSFKVMSLAESKDDKKGVEVGLVFRELTDYQCFKSVIEQRLQAFRA